MPSEGEKQQQQQHKQLDREIREMVSAITNRVTDFHKSGGSAHHHHHLHHPHNVDSNNQSQEEGIRIITLAGTNDGATLKSELDHKSGKISSPEGHWEAEELSTYVNSNFQAINNSMMLGGSYHANDPGVHLEIEDFSEGPHKAEKKDKKKSKNKEDRDKDHASRSSDRDL